jgi:peptidoglycan/LPS O-acetylase OafA/YrhL
MTPIKLPRLPALDALRGFGAAVVVLGHVGFATGAVGMPYWGWWLSRSEVVVSMFFMVSGFVLFRPFAHAKAAGVKPLGTNKYLLRRFLRITPAYWLTVIISFTLLLETPADLETWARHLTYTQFYGRGHFLPGIGQAWSLTVEAAFYVLLPLLAPLLLGRRWRPRLTVALCLLLIPVSVAWAWAIGHGELNVFIHPMWVTSYAACFGTGMALATIEVALLHGNAPRSWRVLKELGGHPWAWLGIGIGLYAVVATPVGGPRGGLGISHGNEFAARLVLYAAIAACILIPVALGERTRLHSVLHAIPMRWLGTISFGLFLWHPFMMHIIDDVSGRHMFGRDPLSMYLFTMAGSVVLAAISWYGIERPVINWGRTRTSSARPVSREPQQDNSAQPGQLRPDGGVAIAYVLSHPGAAEEQTGRHEPEPATARSLHTDLVGSRGAPEQQLGHEEHRYAGNGEQHAGQTTHGYQGQPTEDIEALTAEAVPARYVGRASVPWQHSREEHQTDRTGAH